MTYNKDNDKIINIDNIINPDSRKVEEVDIDNFDELLEEYKKEIDFNPFRGRDFFLIALFCLKKKQSSEALNYLLKATELEPDMWEAHYNLGVIYLNFKHTDKAEKEFLTVIDNNPTHIYTYLNLTNIYLKENKLEEASHVLSKGLEKNPGNRLLLNNYGVVLARLERFHDAIKVWERLEALVPDEVEPYYNQAITYARMGMIEIAIKKFRKILELSAEDFGVYANLGNLYEKKNEFDNAIEMYEKALEIDPDNYNVMASMGLVYAKKNEFSKAISIYREICHKEPHNIKNLMNLSMIYAIQGKYKEAVSLLVEAEKIEADDAELLFNLALNYNNIKKYDVSDKYFEKTIKLNPHNEEVYVYYAKSLCEREKNHEALKVLEDGLSRLEKSSSILYLITKVSVSLHRLKSAADYARRLIDLAPESYSSYQLLIDVYRLKRNTSKIWVVYDRAIRNIKNDGNLFLDYGKDLCENGDYEKAEKYLMKALRLMPHSQEVMYNLFIVYSFLGKTEFRDKYKEMCIRINPFSEWARLCEK